MKGAKNVLQSIPKLDIEIHCSLFTDRPNNVKNLLDLLPLSEYDLYIQSLVDDEIVPFDPNFHTPQTIAQYDIVHLFAKPSAVDSH